MNCKTITERLKRVAAIVDSWKNENSVPQIERDIALGELRDIYNALLVVETEIAEPDAVDAVVEEQKPVVEAREPMPRSEVATPEVASMEAFYDALDIDALLGLTNEPVAEQGAVEEAQEDEAETYVEAQEDDTESVEESVEEEECSAEMEEMDIEDSAENNESAVVEPAPEPIAEKSEPVAEEPKPIAEEPKPIAEEPKPVGAGLFDLNDIPVRSKSRRKMISLYSDNPVAVQTPAEPQKAEESVKNNIPEVSSVPVAEVAPKVESVAIQPQQRLGDSFGEVKTLADQMAKDDHPTTPFNRITALRQAIGLNDKFLMIRDLFGGDAERYEATIDTLDEFEDLDECIIYIVENFRWNPDLEAAKLLVSLIERKLA